MNKLKLAENYCIRQALNVLSFCGVVHISLSLSSTFLELLFSAEHAMPLSIDVSAYFVHDNRICCHGLWCRKFYFGIFFFTAKCDDNIHTSNMLLCFRQCGNTN